MKKRIKWNKKLIIKFIKDHNGSRAIFNKSSAYNAAKRLNISSEELDEYLNPRKIKKWNKNNIQKEALKYKTRGQFRKKSCSAYNAAIRLSILNEVCIHMKSVYKIHSIKELKQEALKYTSRYDFQKGSCSHYKQAYRKGILDDISKHMDSLNYWNFDNIKKEALKYSSRREFSLKSGSAYNAANRLSIMNKVCSHMPLNDELSYHRIFKKNLENTLKKFKVKFDLYHEYRIPSCKKKSVIDFYLILPEYNISIPIEIKLDTKYWTKKELNKQLSKYDANFIKLNNCTCTFLVSPKGRYGISENLFLKNIYNLIKHEYILEYIFY